MKNFIKINRALVAKKKLFFFFLALAASIGTMIAETVKIGDLYYNLNDEDKTAEVTSSGGDNYSGDIVIPATVLFNNITYSITSIRLYAFDECTSLTSINIPNSVTYIGEGAFFKCIGLTSIDIPNSVTSIGEYAFGLCAGLISVTCYATTPPALGEAVFSGQNSDYSEISLNSQIPLYVPIESIDAYKAADQWRDFLSILPISAQETETTEVEIITTTQVVDITWPSVTGAATYELVIKDKSGNVICTLIFNAQGQLVSIASNAPSRDGAPQHTQVAGFSFTVTGLEAGTSYDLTIIAKDENGQEIDKKDISFHTDSPQGIEDLHIDSDKSVKVLMDGQIYILRGDHTFDTQGKMIK